MALATVTKSDLLSMALQGTDPAWRAGATCYLALTAAATFDPDAPLAGELTYTGYARVALTKATAFSGSAGARSNANLIQFGKRTDAGATQTAKFAVLVDTASGAVAMAIAVPLDDDLPVSINVQPQFAAGDLDFNAI
jgi:hypothetical protein